MFYVYAVFYVCAVCELWVRVWVCVSVGRYRYRYMYKYNVCMCGYVYGVCLCVIMSWVACCSGSDPFGEIRTRYRRLRVVPAINPIVRRFENRSMGWSRDPYQFVQWRPDGDSISKPCHFSECLRLYHFLNYRCQYYLYITCIILCDYSDIFDQYDYPYHFIWCQWVYTFIIQFIWTLISVILCNS